MSSPRDGKTLHVLAMQPPTLLEAVGILLFESIPFVFQTQFGSQSNCKEITSLFPKFTKNHHAAIMLFTAQRHLFYDAEEKHSRRCWRAGQLLSSSPHPYLLYTSPPPSWLCRLTFELQAAYMIARGQGVQYARLHGHS